VAARGASGSAWSRFDDLANLCPRRPHAEISEHPGRAHPALAMSDSRGEDHSGIWPCQPIAALSTPPVVAVMTAGSETAGFSDGRRFGEAVRDPGRVVRVTSECDRCSACFAPPPDNLRVQRPAGVDLQCAAAAGKRAQRVMELVLEPADIERPGSRWPGTQRVVDVSKHREGVRAFDQPRYLGQVLPDDIARWPVPVQNWLTGRQAVQRTEHPVELSGLQQPADGSAVPMWFAQLHSADDVKVRELVAAALQALQISVEIQFWRDQCSIPCGMRCEMVIRVGTALQDRPGRVVGVLGERDSRQAHGYRAGTCLLHRPVDRIPGPLAMYMTIRWHRHDRIPFQELARLCPRRARPR